MECYPHDRVWPGQRCDYCQANGFQCSANRVVRKSARSDQNDELQIANPRGLQIFVYEHPSHEGLEKLKAWYKHVEGIRAFPD